jgi:hypothetical protein
LRVRRAVRLLLSLFVYALADVLFGASGFQEAGWKVTSVQRPHSAREKLQCKFNVH